MGRRAHGEVSIRGEVRIERVFECKGGGNEHIENINGEICIKWISVQST